MNKSKDAQIYYHDTRSAIAWGKLKKAEVSLTRILKSDPENCLYLFVMAEVLMEKKEYKKACYLCRKGLIMNSKSAQAFSIFGYCLQMLGKTDEGLEMYRKALSLDPKFSDTHYSMAVLLTTKENYEEAEKHYMEVLKLDPEREYLVYNCLGYSYFLQGEFTKAVPEFEKSINSDKEYTLAYCNMSLVLFCEDRSEEARGFFEEGIKNMRKYINKIQSIQEMITKYKNEKVNLERKLYENDGEEKGKVLRGMINGLIKILELLLDKKFEEEKILESNLKTHSDFDWDLKF